MKKGFTLLETLVAITILLIAVVGPMSAIGGSLAQISTARDQAIAINLAQEGVEIVRQGRDSNMISCWGSFTSPCTTWDTGLIAGQAYVVNTTSSPALTSCGASCTSPQMTVRQDVNGWYYQTTSGTGGATTKFSRVVNISGSGAERTITSTVTWIAGGTPKAVQASESIFGINS